MGIQAVKGVEIGDGFALAELRGSEAHDEIGTDHRRMSNRAGGIEGGMSNGEEIVVRAGMKPLPTLMKPLASVDLRTGEAANALVERSDVSAVEALAHAAVDVSGRPYCVHTGEPDHLRHFTIAGNAVPYHTVVNRHVFETLANNARIALHVRVLYGRDPHHITEAEYKAVSRALRQAVELDPRVSGVPSTKGTL